MTDRTDPNALYVAIETFATTLNGQQVVVERGSKWKGELPQRCSAHFLRADEADEPALHAARAALAERIKYA